MKTEDYLKILVEEIHSATVATIADDGHPQTRVIDMMLYDENGMYFLTAKGKAVSAASCAILSARRSASISARSR